MTQIGERRVGARTVLVTGATEGIGYQTALALARDGAQVVITGPWAASGEHAAAAVRRESGQASVTFIQADHATVAGNRLLAQQVRMAVPRLDVLVNNAGGSYASRTETADGYEATLAANFLGPFTLTYELLPLLQANPPARCINVVPAAAKLGRRDPFQDLQSTREFVGGHAYARAKLLNMLFSLALAKWVSAEQVTVNLIHPGVDRTQLPPSTTPASRFLRPLVRPLQRRALEKAGQRVAALATSPLAASVTGRYFEAKPTPERLSAPELDPQRQRRTWQVGCELMADAAGRLPRAQPA